MSFGKDQHGRLLPESVMHIRTFVADGGARRDMEILYNVHAETVARIVRGSGWKGVAILAKGREEQIAEQLERDRKLMERLADAGETRPAESAELEGMSEEQVRAIQLFGAKPQQIRRVK